MRTHLKTLARINAATGIANWLTRLLVALGGIKLVTSTTHIEVVNNSQIIQNSSRLEINFEN